jgi:hypothetical protein
MPVLMAIQIVNLLNSTFRTSIKLTHQRIVSKVFHLTPMFLETFEPFLSLLRGGEESFVEPGSKVINLMTLLS